MVSEQPMDGRCAAEVFDKVGLEVHDDERDASYMTSEDLENVVLERGAVTSVKGAEYDDVLPHLREGFELVAVELSRSEADESDDDLTRVSVADDDPYVTNHQTDLQGYCERYPMEDTTACPVHGGKAGPPEGNLNGMDHGMYAKRSSYYKNLDQKDKVVVEQFVDGWLDLSSYTRDDGPVVNELYRIAVDQIRLWDAQDEFDKGLVYDQMADWDPEAGKIYAEQENPANLPYDRLDKTSYQKLSKLGVLDDPESQKADSMESLADKFEELAS